MIANERSQDFDKVCIQSSHQDAYKDSHGDEADGCDVVLTDEEAVSDEDLPPAEGGVA
jgi:hypothetical protein